MKRKSKNNVNYQTFIPIIIIAIIMIFGAFSETEDNQENLQIEKKDQISNNEKKENNTSTNIPKYSGTPYTIINNNIPYFKEEEYTTLSFEKYSELDNLGRCQVAYANVCIDIMPKKGEKRGNISDIKPTGWKQKKYDKNLVEGESLYNRCHLIGYQLSAENANEKNLITGTRYMNVEGMLPFENLVDDYIEEHENNHVLYRVTPIFEGNNLVASGVQMEAYSVEDKGEGICYNVYVYNVQPGIKIDYKTGENELE